MRQLLLLRHAKSAWDDPAATDHARSLNARGRDAAAAMGARMRALGLRPDLVLVSSARRTMQTLEALPPWAAGPPPRIEASDALYLASARQLTEALQAVTEPVRSVLLIGHNPGLHDLAIGLVGAGAMAAGDAVTQRLAEGYPTGALCEFDVAGPWWSLAAGAGRLVRFVAPRDLAGATA